MGIIRRSFTHLDDTIFLSLYKALVRPHLEYASPVWNPSQVKLKKLIENVQRRATRMLPGFSELEYTERLRKLDLPCMAYRKIRGDIIEVFKMLKGYYDEEIEPPLIKNQSRSSMQLRGNDLKLSKSKIKRASRANFFKNRVVNIWNELPGKVLDAPSIVSFERRLDKFWNNFNIKYDFDACLNFEKRRLNPDSTGTGIRRANSDNDCDLDIQEY